ncbi:hypothetical protein PRIPAC_77377 [Pristionchus pacificus]|uniref:Uncharacterized protein n=1 Tax=Pristionchus pacificus TaxID=54126 RepID=A0A2A6CJ76_PRIPA|nr:hypothetical protein PRIPAC_77377 [Pristionchus pacificus]|eukprot:PDM78160.1 hypothetical protein PRIPAC_30739 [Pristionchus pacificus]
MKIIVKPAKETYVDADWVSRIKLLRQEIGQLIPDSPQGIENIKYTVEHIEVFKKPSSLRELSSEISGSTLGNLLMLEGNEYLLCGRMKENGKLSCAACGQVKPDEIYYLVAKWNDIPAAFIEEMKTFQS